jgi:TrmH family RNA methyltransferase
VTVLTSKDNPKVRHWQKLAEDARYRRTKMRALIEGPHLLAAALEHGHKPAAVLATEQGMANAEIRQLVEQSGAKPALLSPGVFRRIVDAENPPGIAAEIAIPSAKERAGNAVFLEGIQDPGNVGAILRSAAAFGVVCVVLDPGCADPWSPKALRAGMGGQFNLQLAQAPDLGAEIAAFKGTVICTVPRGGTLLSDIRLNGAMAWLFGAEGRGLSEETMRSAAVRVTIPMAEGSESLNVAAAAAICLYETFRRSEKGS